MCAVESVQTSWEICGYLGSLCVCRWSGSKLSVLPAPARQISNLRFKNKPRYNYSLLWPQHHVNLIHYNNNRLIHYEKDAFQKSLFAYYVSLLPCTINLKLFIFFPVFVVLFAILGNVHMSIYVHRTNDHLSTWFFTNEVRRDVGIGPRGDLWDDELPYMT